MTYDLVIKHGTLVTATHEVLADLAISGEQIAAIGHDLHGERELDATGKLVIPGGVDIHVHMQMPLPGGVVSADDFFTGTRAAAIGGTTAIVDFVAAEPGEPLMTAFGKRRAEADGSVAIDYGLHMTIAPDDLNKLSEMRAVYDAGCTTFKLYMAYGFRLNDGELLQALQAVRQVGGLAVVHAENWDVIQTLIALHLAAGNTSPHWHPRTRPAALEGEATGRVIDIASFVGVPVHIFHVSCDATVQRIADARRRGLPVTGETCPQYLFKTWDAYDAPGLDGALPVCAPPIRSQAEQDALWQALSHGHLQLVTTDHCPFVRADKARGLDDFSQIPGGVPSIEMRLAGIYQGVRHGLLTRQQWVAACSTAPARLAGFVRKGELAPGYDADVVIFDPARRDTLSVDTLHENVDWTPYDGLTLQGFADTTLVRGRVVARQGEFTGEAGYGRYVKRGRPQGG